MRRPIKRASGCARCMVKVSIQRCSFSVRDLAGAADLGCQRDPHGVQQLRGHGRADGQEVVLVAAVVAGHLAPAR